jgi:thiosulfate/3-mercaptopyruvate sulfurtransferase
MNKTKRLLIPIIVFLCLFPLSALAQALSPILSTEDLATSLKNPDLVVVDIRKVEDYKAGHIPGAINVFYGTWAIKKGDSDNELPADDDLMDTLSSAGIRPESPVVVYSQTGTGPDRVNTTRVAWTMKYAGVKNISVLSGGFEKWSIREKRPLTEEVTRPKSVPYKGKFDKNVLATKSYVQSRLGKALIVDVREPDFFNGAQKLPFVAKAGRIAGAVNLPTAQVFDKYPPGEHLETCCYTFKGTDVLKNMATGVIGGDLNREIIVYCDSGRVASTWWFILHEVLGYKDVRNYDGSMQEWAKDPSAPVNP